MATRSSGVISSACSANQCSPYRRGSTARASIDHTIWTLMCKYPPTFDRDASGGPAARRSAQSRGSQIASQQRSFGQRLPTSWRRRPLQLRRAPVRRRPARSDPASPRRDSNSRPPAHHRPGRLVIGPMDHVPQPRPQGELPEENQRNHDQSQEDYTPQDTRPEAALATMRGHGPCGVDEAPVAEA